MYSFDIAIGTVVNNKITRWILHFSETFQESYKCAYHFHLLVSFHPIDSLWFQTCPFMYQWMS